jgi:hypothetical protein
LGLLGSEKYFNLNLLQRHTDTIGVWITRTEFAAVPQPQSLLWLAAGRGCFGTLYALRGRSTSPPEGEPVPLGENGTPRIVSSGRKRRITPASPRNI